MHTLSGRRFDIGNGWKPTFKDVAFSLSRMQRWGGVTLVPWTVLQHVLAMHRLAVAMEGKPTQRLYTLWHDVDEMATGDIPKPFKTAEQSALAEELRQWFYKEVLKVTFPSSGDQDLCKFLDVEARVAEAHVFCHPRHRSDFKDYDVPMDLVDIIWDIVHTSTDRLLDEFIASTEAELRLLGRKV